MIKLKCAICGDKQKLRTLYPANFDADDLSFKKFSARRIPDGRHYRFVECQRCGLIFSNPIIETEKIDKLYEQSEFIYQSESNYLKKTYGGLLSEAIQTLDVKNPKLLEIGCGNGFFLEEAQRLGIKDVYGIEPSFPAVKQAKAGIKKRIKVDILKPGLFKANSFDLVCCFHTLDHIVYPNKFLETAFKYMKKGGRIIFVVHDTQGLSVKLFGEKSAIFDIEHIYLFNKSNLEKIFSKNGFSVTGVKDIMNTYPLGYWFKMVPFPKLLKRFVGIVFERTGIGSLALSLKVGNIAIFATKS